MLPDNRASVFPIPGRFCWPDSLVTSRLVDYELGGLAINDASQGLMVQRWTLSYRANTDVVLKPDSGSETVLFSTSEIEELSLAFDQNMRPHVAYAKADHVHLWWFDTTEGDYVFTDFGVGRCPRLALDDKRPTQVLTSDIIFAYIRGANLYYRQQRDRFATERLLRSNIDARTRLKNIGMSQNWRMQFEFV